MSRHVEARITQGEMYGAPVPGGWPHRGPFRVVGDAAVRLFRKRKSVDGEDGARDDDRSVPEK